MPNPLFAPRIIITESSTETAPGCDPTEPSPPPVPGGRPKGCKRLHTNATVAATRRLIEQTPMTYKEIAAITGPTAATVGTWTRQFGWTRHPFAPRASDTVPTARAGRRLKLRMLGTRLHELAERCVNELWADPKVDLERLIEAMQVLRMARLEAMGSRRPRRPSFAKPQTGQEWFDREAAIRTALKDLRWGGVDIDRIPAEAMALLEDAHTPPEKDCAAVKPRGPRRRK